ncbi:hypothetical protein LOTGIDRAFT_161033 [Lottia gigantea]|uniref:Uncharacterized protein n=1 Tax=Lottia gigantea TaxID=225164 RepID=V4AD51_LOTGI|nr:hypothetical protein LOTGIDRAFT_161033 [Lottia gigantea]ESO94782.1 hypothetical protein LOTGIDRAFT_161033 [Lottia gigantea]
MSGETSKTDWNKIFKKNKQYMKTKNQMKSKIEDKRLSQMGLDKNLSTLFSRILKQQEEIQKKLVDPPVGVSHPPLEIEHPPANQFIIWSHNDIIRHFSNPSPDLPKSIKPIVDNEGLMFNRFRIRFNENAPQVRILTKPFIYTLIEGLIDLMNGPETNRSKEGDRHIKAINENDEYIFDNMMPRDSSSRESSISSGEGITFLSDDPEQLLNRLNIIIEAIKHVHQSNFNEIRAILKKIIRKRNHR